MKINSVGLIPCRLDSQRLKNKLIKKISGYPLFAHTYFQSVNSKLDEVYVCSGDKAIIDWCEKLKINYVKTIENHSNGTERCAEAGKLLKLKDNDIIINIQGDEPLIKGNNLNLLINQFNKNIDASVTTLHQNMASSGDLNSTKLVFSSKNKVMYISRADIPYSRNGKNKSIHIGVFCFEFQTLKKLIKFKPSSIEKKENIELIRCLENDINVYSFPVQNKLIGVDTMNEFREVKSLLERDLNYTNSIMKYYLANQ